MTDKEELTFLIMNSGTPWVLGKFGGILHLDHSVPDLPESTTVRSPILSFTLIDIESGRQSPDLWKMPFHRFDGHITHLFYKNNNLIVAFKQVSAYTMETECVLKQINDIPLDVCKRIFEFAQHRTSRETRDFFFEIVRMTTAYDLENIEYPCFPPPTKIVMV